MLDANKSIARLLPYQNRKERNRAIPSLYKHRVRRLNGSLTPAYIQWVEVHFAIDKSHFQEAFHMQGDFVQQRWEDVSRLWINPPWQFVSDATCKLFRHPPREFVFIGPDYLRTWVDVMRTAPFRTVTPPRTLGLGYFQRYFNNILQQDLPFSTMEPNSFSRIWPTHLRSISYYS